MPQPTTLIDKVQMEIITATYPTQEKLLEATDIYIEFTDHKSDHKAVFVICNNDHNWHIQEKEMVKLSHMYAKNNKFFELFKKADKQKAEEIERTSKSNN